MFRHSPRPDCLASTCPTGSHSPPPAATPPQIVERLNREVVRACAQPRLRDAFGKQAAVAVTSTPQEITQHLAREIGVWRDIVTRANITIQ